MKTIGIIGGMSPESTVLYYQIINRGTNRRLGGNRQRQMPPRTHRRMARDGRHPARLPHEQRTLVEHRIGANARRKCVAADRRQLRADALGLINFTH